MGESILCLEKNQTHFLMSALSSLRWRLPVSPRYGAPLAGPNGNQDTWFRPLCLTFCQLSESVLSLTNSSKRLALVNGCKYSVPQRHSLSPSEWEMPFSWGAGQRGQDSGRVTSQKGALLCPSHQLPKHHGPNRGALIARPAPAYQHPESNSLHGCFCTVMQTGSSED